MIGHLLGRDGRRLLHGYLTGVVVYALAEGAAYGLLVPFLTALLGDDPGGAAHWLVPLGGCALIGWAAHYQLGLRALRLSTLTRRILYRRIGDTLPRLPLGWYDGPAAATVPQVVAGDVARLSNAAFLAQPLAATILIPATCLTVLLAADWRLGLAGLAAVPVVLAAVTVGGRLTGRTEAAQHAATAEAGHRLIEFAGAQPTLRAAGHTASGRATLDDALAAQHRAARREITGVLPADNLGRLAIQLVFTGLLVTGLILVANRAVTPARMIALSVLGVSLLGPLAGLTGTTTGLRAVRAAAGRIRALLTVEPLPEVPASRTPASHRIEFDDVHFGYAAGPPVLRGLTLTIPETATTALVGPSGAGKTTITKLIARFHDVTTGSIRIGGVDVRELPTADLLARVSLVFQDTYLLDTTIEDNIRFGRPGATTEQVRAAGRRARVDTIADRLPDGWASRVGEGGRLLSGGERQRVAIARALLKDAPIVILDEPTAALDAGNEAAIQAALAELATDRTVIIIAHRLSTIAAADRIAVIDGGQVVEAGTHADLLSRDGRYAAFWHERTRAQGWRLTRPDQPETPDQPMTPGPGRDAQATGTPDRPRCRARNALSTPTQRIVR